MKKTLALLLTLALASGLTACSSPTGDGKTATGDGKTTETTAAGTAGTDAPDTSEADKTESSELVKGTGVNLTVYSNSVSDGRGDWLVERASKDGFSIQYVDAGGADVYSRLVAEKNAPVADVSFGLYSMLWESLKEQNLLVSYTPAWADKISEGLNDPDDYYHAIVKQAILMAYDKNQITEADAPKDWPDLWTKEQYSGTYEFSASLGGATVRHVIAGILTRYADPAGDLGISDEGWEQIALYYKNGVPSQEGVDLYAHISDSSDPILYGQIWSSGIAARDEQYGTDTGIVVPEAGVPFVVESIGIINGTKNLEESQRFVDWFGSAQIQGEWAQQFSTLPANNDALSGLNDFNKMISSLPAQDIDWSLAAKNIDAWCEKIELQYMP